MFCQTVVTMIVAIPVSRVVQSTGLNPASMMR